MNLEQINKVFHIRGKNQGTIKLGPVVSADGDLKNDEQHHFISHAHTDHFGKRKIYDTWDMKKPIIATTPTLKLLETYGINTSLNHQVVKNQEPGNVVKYDSGAKVRLLENNHILGSVQIEVEYEGERYGYSGDFGEDIEDYIDVDYLVMDATYAGKPVEKIWNREEAISRLVEQINDSIQLGPVNICAPSGLLNEIADAMGHSGFWDEYKNVISNEIIKDWCRVYREYKYKQPDIITREDEEELYREILDSGKYIRFANRSRDFKRAVPDGTTFWIENRNVNAENPIQKDNSEPSWFNVALSSHAFSEEIFRYVSNVKPKYIITDATRGGTTAQELERLLKLNFAEIKIISSNLINY